MTNAAQNPDTTELHILNTHRGHKKSKESITVESSIAERKALAKKVTAFVRDGYTVLSNGKRITGYDAKINEWITRSARAKKQKVERIPAKGTTANAVAPISGG